MSVVHHRKETQATKGSDNIHKIKGDTKDELSSASSTQKQEE